MTSFDWLHISDLHFGHGDASYGHDQALVLQSLADDAINQVDNSEVPRPQAIFVTGDIANSGDARGLDEYELAASWLTDLADRLAVPTGSIYCVPGNHDVNRSAAKSDEVLKWVLQACRLGAGVDEALDSPASRSALAKSFESYSRFLTSHASPACLGADGTGLCWQTELPLTEQFTLRLVGINTALLSADDTDEGKLQVGKHQLREAFTPAPGTDTVTLVLSHHPFSWLADSTQVSGWVEKHADIHLVGHLHEQRSSTSRTGGRNELTVLAAGAAHGDDAAPHQHGYNFGRVEIGDDNRGTIRMWPRIWSDKAKSFTLDAENVDEDEGTSASHAMRKRFSPRNVEDQSRIRTVARTALEALGSGSTAFPRDLSVRELSAEGLIVPPKVISPTSTLDVSDIAVELESGRSVLLLGEPGAGKTVLVYSVCERLLSGGTRAPLVISVASVAGKAIDAASVAAAVVTPDGQPVLPADITRDGVVIIADGIDEALASGSAARDVGAVLAGLPSVAPSLVACRRLEFDDQLSSRVGNDRYLACSVAPWRVEVEFADFIRRLTEAGRLSSTDLVARISGSSEMRGLVARPLYARMLTAVLSEIGDLDVSDTAALYANYLHSLANTVEARLARTGCEDANVYALWRAMAWQFFEARLFHEDSLPGTAPTDWVVSQGVTRDCAQNIAAGLFDFSTASGDLRARYRHFSFYEYLVADHVAHALVERVSGGAVDISDLFRHDLPQEMRRHLVAIVKRTAPEAVVRLLGTQFSRLRVDLADEAERLIVGNLAAYVLGRIGASSELLRSLLGAEDEPFLRTSLLWALANAGDDVATAGYLDELREDVRMAELNRGYLLYYYGDLDRSLAPPYVDREPDRDWTNTRARVTALLSESGYGSSRSVSRQALDAWTFTDLLRFHDMRPTETEAALLKTVRDNVAASNGGLGERLCSAMTLIGVE